MSEDKLEALRKIVKQRANIEESRNALLQLLKRNAIKPEEVMEFVEHYQDAKKLEQSPELPKSIKCYLKVNYGYILEAIKKGYAYAPMVSGSLYTTQNDDEIFEVEIPLKGIKQITAKQGETIK